MKKLKVECRSCNDWGIVKKKAVDIRGIEMGYYIDIECPKKCRGQRKSEDPWEYENA